MLDVTDFGCAASDCTSAIRSALIAATRGSTRVVLIPGGVTASTLPFVLPSGVTLQVDGMLQALAGERALSKWPMLPPLPTYGRDRDGAKPHRYQALVSANRAADVVIRGRGVIDGQGPWWWDQRHVLRAGRPHLIEFYNCTHVEVAGVVLRDSPFWTLHPVYSQFVWVHDLTIRAPAYAPNTDGVDPDSCRHVLIERCDISVGDDHVAIKAGLNAVARGSAEFATENVTVRHNVLRAGMGISVGSETSGGIRDVDVHNNQFIGWGWSVALHVKSAPQRGGKVENILFRHNDVFNTTALMRLGIFGRGTPPTDYPQTALRAIEWFNNTYSGPSNRKVRSKFLCPGICNGIKVASNRVLAERSTWQCSQISSYVVADNSPSGLDECMQRSARKVARHAAEPAETRSARASDDGALGLPRRPRSSRHRGGNGEGEGREQRRAKRRAAPRRRAGGNHRRYRKFDWHTQQATWSAEL